MGEELPFDYLAVYDKILDFLKSLEEKPKPKKSSKEEETAEEKAREEERGNTVFKIKIKNCPTSEKEKRKEIREGKRKVEDGNSQLAYEHTHNTKKVKLLISKKRSRASTSVSGPSSEQTAPSKLTLDLNQPPPDDF